MTLERCFICDEPTGKAGRFDDSLYCDLCGEGPFCEDHFATHKCFIDITEFEQDPLGPALEKP